MTKLNFKITVLFVLFQVKLQIQKAINLSFVLLIFSLKFFNTGIIAFAIIAVLFSNVMASCLS